MIIDKIENASYYYGLSPQLEAGLKSLENVDFSQVEPGRYSILGDDCFALVQTYETKPLDEGRWEAHRKYIDIQFLAKGKERMGYAATDKLKVVEDYNESKDVMFFDGKGEFFDVCEGEFVVFTPQDAHMPSLIAHESDDVIKVVIKVAV